jgi:hypothetical protein
VRRRDRIEVHREPRRRLEIEQRFADFRVPSQARHHLDESRPSLERFELREQADLHTGVDDHRFGHGDLRLPRQHDLADDRAIPSRNCQKHRCVDDVQHHFFSRASAVIALSIK